MQGQPADRACQLSCLPSKRTRCGGGTASGAPVGAAPTEALPATAPPRTSPAASLRPAGNNVQTKKVNTYQYTLNPESYAACDAAFFDAWKNATGFDEAVFRGEVPLRRRQRHLAHGWSTQLVSRPDATRAPPRRCGVQTRHAAPQLPHPDAACLHSASLHLHALSSGSVRLCLSSRPRRHARCPCLQPWWTTSGTSRAPPPPSTGA